MKERRCRVYAVELGPKEVYVGATNKSARQRFRQHKAGGRLSSGIVRRKGKRLRPDLSRGFASETALAQSLRRKGYKVHGARSKMHVRKG